MTLNKIPKIIWQTHEWEYSELPQNYLSTSLTWKNLNPDWEYRYLSGEQREQYVRNNNYLLWKIYKLSDKVSQADLWRYVATYTEGGVYADMDSICTVPLTYMLEKDQNNAEIVVVPSHIDKVLFNSHFAAVQSSKTMKKVLENVVAHYKNNDWIQTLMEYDTMEDFWEEFSRRVRLHPEIFCSIVRAEDPELVSYSFVTNHADELKTTFDHDYVVNYYGKEVSYFELAKENGWKTYIPLANSSSS